MKQSKILSLAGLAMKAGKVVSGEFSTENAVKSRQASLIIVAEDASKNTKKLFNDKCKFYEIPVFEYGTKEELGKAIGKEVRSSVGILDEGFAKTMISYLKDSKDNGGSKHGKN